MIPWYLGVLAGAAVYAALNAPQWLQQWRRHTSPSHRLLDGVNASLPKLIESVQQAARDAPTLVMAAIRPEPELRQPEWTADDLAVLGHTWRQALARAEEGTEDGLRFTVLAGAEPHVPTATGGDPT